VSRFVPLATDANREAAAQRLSDDSYRDPDRVGPKGPPPSLVLCSESVHEIPPGICPSRPYWVTPDEDPSMRYPASCDAYSCSTCGPRKAEQVAALMTWSLRRSREAGIRARFVTFTNAPEDWQTRRQAMRNLRRWCLAHGWEWEIGWATEKGSDTGMTHVHGIQHGKQKIPQAALQERWGAIVDIRQIKTPGAATYAMKEARRVAGYTVKEATGDHGSLLEHLALNGGRAAHWSRGFLHGMTKREALSDLRSQLSDGEALTWRLVPAWIA
jgi:hypothetical protein